MNQLCDLYLLCLQAIRLQFEEKEKSLNLSIGCIGFLGEQADMVDSCVVAVVAKWWLLRNCFFIFVKLKT